MSGNRACTLALPLFGALWDRWSWYQFGGGEWLGSECTGRSSGRPMIQASGRNWPHPAFHQPAQPKRSQTPANPMNSHHKSGESSLRVLSHLARNRIPY